MTIVVLPDGRKARFPDDMPREQIKSYIDGKQQPQTIEEAHARSNAPEWMKKIADRMVDEGRTEPTFGEMAEIVFRGGLRGSADLGGRALNGATFGASDWAARKAGINPTQGIEDMIDNASSDREAGIIGLVSGGSEMAGGFPTGGGLYKGVSKGLTAIPKVGNVAKYFAPAVSGAITGGSYGGFGSDSLEGAERGAIRGAVIGQAFDLAGRGLNKALSAAGKIKGVERGFENAVASDKGSRVLNRGIKESQDIAKQVYGQAPSAKQNINIKMTDTLDDLTRGSNPKGVVAAAKKDYADFLEANKSKQFVRGKFTHQQYQANLKKWGGNDLVLDANGKPLVVYHGTSSDFDSFNNTRPIFTSDKLDVASEYGSKGAIPLYGKMKKPFIVDAYGQNFGEIYNAEGMKKAYKDLTAQDYKQIAKTFFDGNIKEAKEWFPKTEQGYVNLAKAYGKKPMSTNEWAEYAKANGYDGLIIKDVVDGAELTNVRGNDYVFFNPNQLKTTQNSGAFTKSASLTDKGVVPQPKPSDLGLNNQLSNNQKAALNKAWQEGANMLKHGEKIGSVKHIDYMERSLNSQINSSMQSNPNGVGMVSSNKTPELMELKGLLRNTMNKSGIDGINQQYTQAKRIEDAYNLGLNYKANSVKTRNIGFETPKEKLAFTEGLFERAKMNPSNTNVSKDILANQDILRDVLPKNSFESLVKQARTNSLSYERINSMENAAARKIGAAEPIGQSTGLLREWLDSTLAPIGAAADMARRAATANSSVKASRYLLNPELPMGRPLYDSIQQYLPTSAVILNESKTKRKEKK